ncbi:MAG TPA: hypothetical protein VM733_09520 [Thermoanaerobaculia bacterium]|nr:hypothetical protein [Thermoanaerobaculia bacterium]
MSFAVSCAIVLGALPGRRDGDRTGNEAWIPLRQLTPREAALLLDRGAAAVVRLDGRDVELATAAYVVAPDRIESATWDQYCSLYRLRRADLETALGRPIRPREIDARYLGDRQVSFRADRVPFYAATEIAFLTLWASGLVLALRRVRRLTAVLPVLVPFAVLPGMFVLLYSPAFLDADLFHQRVVIEGPAYLLASLAPPWVVGLAFASLLAWLVLRLAARFEVERHAVIALTAIAGIAACSLVAMHVRTRQACRADLAIVTDRVTKDARLRLLDAQAASLIVSEDLMKCANAGVRNAIASVLAAKGDDRRHAVRIEVANFGASGRTLFLWRQEFLYADLRDTTVTMPEPARVTEDYVCARPLTIAGRFAIISVSVPRARVFRWFGW